MNTASNVMRLDDETYAQASSNDFIYINGNLTAQNTNTLGLDFLSDIPTGRYPIMHYNGGNRRCP